MLRTVTAAELPAFRKALKARFEADGHKVEHRTLTTPGGPLPNAKMLWRPDPGLWAHFATAAADDPRHLCWYGTDLATQSVQAPAVEINLDRNPDHKAVAGRALKDDRTGEFFLGHKGGLGGGRGGQMSISGFAQRIRGFVREPIVLGKDREEEVFVIGGLDRYDFIDRLHRYVGECVRLRALAKDGGGAGPVSGTPEDTAAEGDGFSPEHDLDGTGAGRPATPHEIRRVHGRVVNALQKRLGKRAVNATRRQMRPDLYIRSRTGGMEVLFEVKGASTTQDWFTAIGQLVVYGASEPTTPKRVLVCPYELQNPAFRAALDMLAITLVTYREQPNRDVEFFGLDPFCPKA